jgi:heterodisulfide reductase subunit D
MTTTTRFPAIFPSGEFLAEVAALRGGERVITCYACGTCSGSCPTIMDMDYGPGHILHMIQLGMEDEVLHSRGIWLCTACYLCTSRCPREVKITETMIGLRGLALAHDLPVPENLIALRDTVTAHHNISGDDNATRLIWSQNVDEVAAVVGQRRQAETLFFVGCVSSFYPMTFGIPQALVQIMLAAGVEFTTLGGDEWCCGYPLLSAGMEAEAVALMEHNVAQARVLGIKRLVATCPSCYHTWKHLYSLFSLEPMGFEILHASEFLAELLQDGQLRLRGLEETVTYHDPCDLGRKSDVYDAPRYVIESIPDLTFVEMDAHGPDAMCCGGGGDVQISDESVTAAVAARRVRQAQKTGARTLLSACQQCKRTLAVAARQQKIRLRAQDVAELVWRAMQA